MNKLHLSLLMQFAGGVIAFFQLQGWVVWPDKPFLRSLSWMYLTSLAIAPLLFYSTNIIYVEQHILNLGNNTHKLLIMYITPHNTILITPHVKIMQMVDTIPS